jgi:hypothetical protein
MRRNSGCQYVQRMTLTTIYRKTVTYKYDWSVNSLDRKLNLLKLVFMLKFSITVNVLLFGVQTSVLLVDVIVHTVHAVRPAKSIHM